MIDIAIVGGGLAGGLTALAVHRAHPELKLALFEAGEGLGGNHRWSWFASDLDEEGNALLATFPTIEWESGYEVRFPSYFRNLTTPYRSLSSTDFDAGLRRDLPADAIRTNHQVANLAADGVTLANGETIDARVVIDCRDFVPSPNLRGGWQVFMGRQLRTETPHSLSHPIIMDAQVDQPGAYRFVYSLPLGDRDLFVEDTYYADAPALDRATLSERIDAYCAAQGWQGAFTGGETGVLPVITGGDFTAYRHELGAPGVVRAGARGGFVHPLTSYTLPFAVANALAIAGVAKLPGSRIAALFERRAADHWRKTAMYRGLGRMLFKGVRADQRYRIFERFYRLREPLIERFYAGRSSAADKFRLVSGKPPIPILDGVRSLLGKGTPLVHGKRQ